MMSRGAGRRRWWRRRRRRRKEEEQGFRREFFPSAGCPDAFFCTTCWR